MINRYFDPLTEFWKCYEVQHADFFISVCLFNFNIVMLVNLQFEYNMWAFPIPVDQNPNFWRCTEDILRNYLREFFACLFLFNHSLTPSVNRSDATKKKREIQASYSTSGRHNPGWHGRKTMGAGQADWLWDLVWYI